MSRRERLALMFAMASAAMGGAMGGEVPQPRFKTTVNISRPKLAGLQFKGVVPKGCKVVTVNFVGEKDGHQIEVTGQIVCATQKSFTQKHTKLRHEVETYIRANSLDMIRKDGLVTIKDKPYVEEVEHTES